MADREAPLLVEIPAAGADRPIWGKVGLVAAAGFVVGIAWPRLTSTRIAPSPPSDSGSTLTAEPLSAATSSGAGAPARSAAMGAKPATAPAAAASGRSAGPSVSAKVATSVSTAAAPGGPIAGGQSAGGQTAVQAAGPTAAARPSGPRDAVPVVGSAFVYRCRDEQQELTECGSLQFDGVAVPRIKGLSRCPAAKGASGKLSLGLEIDFRSKTVHVLLGKSTNLPQATADALLRCADAAFDQVILSGVAHDHHQYTVFYAARFGENALGQPGNEKPSAGAAAAAPPPSDGSFATIAWDVAQLRETPKTGAVVERLLKGAKVKVLAHDGSWYRVQYGTLQGWVYREAIGL